MNSAIQEHAPNGEMSIWAFALHRKCRAAYRGTRAFTVILAAVEGLWVYRDIRRLKGYEVS